MTESQWEVLQWVADGCPQGTKHDKPTAKTSAQALANRGLVTIHRGRSTWRASITDKGTQCLRSHQYPLPHSQQDSRSAETTRDEEAARKILANTDQTHSLPQSVKKRLKLSKDVVYTQEVSMKFEVKITRVQTATRYVTATDQEAAAEKIRAEMEKQPYRMYANFETVHTEIEVTSVQEQRTVKPMQIDREGPLLIPLADAARATGISYTQLSQLAAQGAVEQVKVGSRRFLRRQSLLDFIDRNTYRGWAY